MAILSGALYFINHHPGLATLAMSGIGLGAGALLAIWRRQVLCCVLVIPFFLLSSISYFIAPFANALFLNAFGTRGTAVIVHKQETNEMLNESYIWDYDSVLKTADGRDVALQFSTTSVAIYPIRNEILMRLRTILSSSNTFPDSNATLSFCAMNRITGNDVRSSATERPWKRRPASMRLVRPTRHSSTNTGARYRLS
jgi:hypothetical protein